MTETTQPTTETTALQVYNAEVLDTIEGAREAFLAMLNQVPDPPDDASARIVMQILESRTVEELDQPWDAEGMRDYDGTIIQVNGVHKMPSDYAGGLGTYLVCQCSDIGTGDNFILTTGSVSIVAQLVRAHALQAFPLQVIPRQSERPTKKGYHPMHLELVRRARSRRVAIVQQPAQQETNGS